MTRSKVRLTSPENPFSSSLARRRYADITGDSVSATMPEMVTAPASVRANSRNSEPVSPPWKAMGA